MTVVHKMGYIDQKAAAPWRCPSLRFGSRRCSGVASLVVSIVIMIAALFLLSGRDAYSALGLIGIFVFLIGFGGFAVWLANALGEEQEA